MGYFLIKMWSNQDSISIYEEFFKVKSQSNEKHYAICCINYQCDIYFKIDILKKNMSLFIE